MNEAFAKQKLINYIKERVSLNPHEEEHVKAQFQLKKLSKKEYFIQEGKECQFHGFIVAGTVRVFYIDPKGLEHVLYFGFPDWWVGDIASFHALEPTYINVQAMEESWLLIFSKESIEQLFNEVPVIERLFRIMAQRTLSVLQKRFFSPYRRMRKIGIKNSLPVILELNNWCLNIKLLPTSEYYQNH